MLDSWILATPPPLKPCKDSGPSNACIVPASHQTPCKAGTVLGRPILTPLNHTVYFAPLSSPDPLCGTKETPRGKRKRMERAFHDGLSSDDENEAGSSSTVTRGIPQSLIWETYKPITSLENEDAIYMDQGESHKESPRSACQSTNQVLDGIFSEDDVLQPLQTSSIFNSKDSPRKKLPSPAKSAFVFTAPLPKTHEPDDFLM